MSLHSLEETMTESHTIGTTAHDVWITHIIPGSDYRHRTRFPESKQDGTLLEEMLRLSERSVRHDDIIRCRTSQFVSSPAGASPVVPSAIGCHPGTFARVGQEMAQTLSGGGGC